MNDLFLDMLMAGHMHRIKPLDHEQFEVRLEVPTYVVLTMDRVQKMTDEELLTSTERARVEMEERKTELYGYMLWSARENERLQDLFAQRTVAQKMFNIHLDELKRRNKK